MKTKRIIIAILFVVLLSGCSSSKEGGKDTLSYSPIVCRYMVQPSCWTILDTIPTYAEVRDDNTVKVYCGDFQDRIDSDTYVTMDYIYGETFEITEKQKDKIVSTIKKNKIKGDEIHCDDGVCDGASYTLSFYNSDGEIIQTIGGYEPDDERFDNIQQAIIDVLPKGDLWDVHEKSGEVLKEYLLENYPEEYEFLNNL